MLLRIRVTSFLTGFGVCAGLALYQLRQDIKKSHDVMSHQAEAYRIKLESRVAALEGALSDLRSAAPPPPPAAAASQPQASS
mmetsp:Transcript_8399/g.20948  ORF Transcript_8399/g.20948 Transcript_8399/m.20948 type:complete len:82 (-) Transcript_8399:412-657(-)